MRYLMMSLLFAFAVTASVAVSPRKAEAAGCYYCGGGGDKSGGSKSGGGSGGGGGGGKHSTPGHP